MSGRPQPILCRPAYAADTADAIRLVRTIWGGDDYIPQVWDSWLADPAGFLAVAMWRGRVAGFGHLTELGGGESWLEGLRVAPDLQGRGIGSHLHEYSVSRWLDSESSVVRLLTHVNREPVKAMCAQTGFEPVARVIFRTANAEQGAHAFSETSGSEPKAALALAEGGTAALSSGLMDLGWELADLTADRLAQTDGIQLWSWRNDAGWLATRHETGKPESEATLCAAAGEPLEDLLLEARHLAYELGVEQLHWLAPESDDVLEALDGAGFRAEGSGEAFFVFERRR
jgi:GNAT superfamily N-acetyltransferase